MSYILDALQRADAERERGGVPGLHTRPVAGAVAPTRKGARDRMGLIVAAALALAALAAGLWVWRSPVTPSPVAATPLAPMASSVPTPTPAPTPLPASNPVAIPLPAAAPAAIPKPAPPAPRMEPQPQSKPQTGPAAKGPDGANAAPAPAPLLSELPEDIRRQIPALAITGAVYSDNPAQRLLLVNGQVLTQGSQAAPDVTLVEIRSASSEFSFRGTRFRMAH